MPSPLVKETVKLRKDQVQRLRFLRKAMEDQLGRPYTMDELYQHIVDDFLDENGFKEE
jgi:hypothetical protein